MKKDKDGFRVFDSPSSAEGQRLRECNFPGGLKDDQRAVGVGFALDKMKMLLHCRHQDAYPVYLFLEGMSLEERNSPILSIPFAYMCAALLSSAPSFCSTPLHLPFQSPPHLATASTFYSTLCHTARRPIPNRPVGMEDYDFDRLKTQVS